MRTAVSCAVVRLICLAGYRQKRWTTVPFLMSHAPAIDMGVSMLRRVIATAF